MADVRNPLSIEALEQRIADKTNVELVGETAISSAVGGLAFRDMGQVMEFSKLMALAGQAVPKHLRAAPGACLALSLQALNWRMDPFAVANKSYMVNDRIAYEAQLIHAVIEQRAPIKGRIKGRLEGNGDTRRWILTAQPNDDDEPIVFEGVEIGKITTKNSPLWKADPDQQLWYYTVRAMARRHFPDVILGVYEKEELMAAEGIKDVTPAEAPRSPLQRMVDQARGKAVAEPEDAQEADSALSGEVLPPEGEDQDAAGHWAEGIEDPDGFPGAPEFTEGATAFKAGQPIASVPYAQNTEQAMHWLAGFVGARRAAE